MKRAVALLAAALASVAAAACGGGAEPGAPTRATLVLDFQPNAVHAGIYAALASGFYADRGVDLQVRQPSASTDAPKLLIAGRAQFAILDLNDLMIARARGLKLAAAMPIVQRPLASVIAADRRRVRSPRDLAGATVGVTGLPSDDAVLDSVLRAGGASPGSVHRVTIGFGAASALAAAKVAAATGFWNAEGVALRRQGVPIRVFRVDHFGAPRYPELVLATSGATASEHPALVRAMVAATARGYRWADDHPAAALSDLIDETGDLDPGAQADELRALHRAHAFDPVGSFDRPALRRWARWAVRRGLFEQRPDLRGALLRPGLPAGAGR